MLIVRVGAGAVGAGAASLNGFGAGCTKLRQRYISYRYQIGVAGSGYKFYSTYLISQILEFHFVPTGSCWLAADAANPGSCR
jgi:hypothetical protein